MKLQVSNVVLQACDLRKSQLAGARQIAAKNHGRRGVTYAKTRQPLSGGTVLNDRIIAIQLHSIGLEHLAQENRAAGYQAHHSDRRTFDLFDGFVLGTTDESVGCDTYRSAA